MKYLLDTDHISFLQRRSGPEYAALAARIAQGVVGQANLDLAFSVVSFHEQALGAHTFILRSRTTADLVRGYNLLFEILQGFRAAPVLRFDAAAVAVLDQLQAARVRIAAMDLRIAAIAVSNGRVLLTRNLRDFSKVPGLVAEDWTV